MKRAAVAVALALFFASPAAEARGHSCHEDAVVRVLGRRRCGRFGRWDVTKPVASLSPAVTLEAQWHRLLVTPRAFSAGVTLHGNAATFDLAGSKVGLARTDVGGGRFALEYGNIGPVRLGWAGELGVSNVTGQTFVYSGQSFQVHGAMYGAIGLNAAAGLPLGRFLLRGELFTGLQSLQLYTTSPGVPTPAVAASQELNSLHFRLAPRASAEVWITDYLSAGVSGEMDVVYRDDFALGVFLRGYFFNRGYHDPRM